jgi:hypothetical protein
MTEEIIETPAAETPEVETEGEVATPATEGEVTE